MEHNIEYNSETWLISWRKHLSHMKQHKLLVPHIALCSVIIVQMYITILIKYPVHNEITTLLVLAKLQSWLYLVLNGFLFQTLCVTLAHHHVSWSRSWALSLCPRQSQSEQKRSDYVHMLLTDVDDGVKRQMFRCLPETQVRVWPPVATWEVLLSYQRPSVSNSFQISAVLFNLHDMSGIQQAFAGNFPIFAFFLLKIWPHQVQWFNETAQPVIDVSQQEKCFYSLCLKDILRLCKFGKFHEKDERKHLFPYDGNLKPVF